MRSRDPVEFGTSLGEDWVELYLFFGAIHPHLVGTAAIHIIAVSCLFYITTFIWGVAKKFCIFDIGYSEIKLLMIYGIQASISMKINGLQQFFAKFLSFCMAFSWFFP